MTHGGADHGETENIRFNEIHAFNTLVKFCMSKKSVGLASKLKLLSHGQKEEKVEAAQPWAEGGESLSCSAMGRRRSKLKLLSHGQQEEKIEAAHPCGQNEEKVEAAQPHG